MTRYRETLPQLEGGLFLTDGGLETTLIFHDGLDLPYFAAFDLLRREGGREAMARYYRTHAAIAQAHGLGFVFESATWRASADWGAKLGYDAADLAEANRDAVALLCGLRDEASGGGAPPMVVSGCIGPRGDGYDASVVMTAEAAQRYHTTQIETLADTGADMVTALTMTNAPEAIGIARAAQAAGIPSAISFTVETDGRLPSGRTLRDAVESVDAATEGLPAYYMVNCAHPTHFEGALVAGAEWMGRVRGIRANASTKSHAELDEATALDDGNPEELGRQYAALRGSHGQVTVLGGCCGTDHRHIEAIAGACAAGS